MQATRPHRKFPSIAVDVRLMRSMSCHEGVKSVGDGEPKDGEAAAAWISDASDHYGGVGSEYDVGFAGTADVYGG